MWAWDAGAGALVPAWTNSDGSTAAVALVYDAEDDVLLLVGDVAAFEAAMRVEVTPVVSRARVGCGGCLLTDSDTVSTAGGCAVVGSRARRSYLCECTYALGKIQFVRDPSV
jgi:hypothetical protein